MTKETKPKKLVCPFHGLVNAEPSAHGYTCEVKNCEIVRKENELES